MIQKVRIKNLQSHKDSLIEFHKGVNVIVGDTDSGKSAIIRSLDKVVNNKLPSKNILSNWGGVLSVELTVDDTSLILKHDKRDSYILNGTKFAAVGNAVPDEIKNLINLDEINMQAQIDSFFLLNETPGYVATYLNKIANLEQIDSTNKSIKKELNETKRNIEHEKKDLQAKEVELVAYDYLPSLADAIVEIIKLEEVKRNIELQITKTELQISILTNLINTLTKIEKEEKENETIIKLKPAVDSTLQKIEKQRKVKLDRNNLGQQLSKLRAIDLKIAQLNEIALIRPMLNFIFEQKEKERILDTKLETLNSLIGKVSELDEKIELAKSKFTKRHSLYHAELKLLDNCFFCGSKLN